MSSSSLKTHFCWLQISKGQEIYFLNFSVLNKINHRLLFTSTQILSSHKFSFDTVNSDAPQKEKLKMFGVQINYLKYLSAKAWLQFNLFRLFKSQITRCELSKIWVACSCRLFPWGNGSEKEGSSERWFLPNLCRTGAGSGPRIHPTASSSVELDRDSGSLRGFLCAPFPYRSTGCPRRGYLYKICFEIWKRIPREEFCPCLEIRVLGNCKVCTKNECSSLDSMSKSVLADPVTPQGFRAWTEWAVTVPVPDHAVVPLSYLGSLYQGCHYPHFLPGKRCGTESFPSCCHQQAETDNSQATINCRTQ